MEPGELLASNPQAAQATPTTELLSCSTSGGCIASPVLPPSSRPWPPAPGVDEVMQQDGRAQGLGHSLGSQQHILSGMQVTGVGVLPVQIL